MPKKPPTHDPKGRTPEKRLAERRASHDKRRALTHPWRTLYSTARWRELRAYVLRRDPACRICLHDQRVTPATVCDHIVEHKGDPALFWGVGNVWGLCGTCHNSVKQRIEKAIAKASKETVEGVYEYLRHIYSLTVQFEE